MRTAGILGGLGPQSTALFYEEIIRIAQGRKLVKYPKMLINSMCIWDFSKSMHDRKRLYKLLASEMARMEEQVDFLAMVCNTAHCVLEPLRRSACVPMLAIQEEVVKKVWGDGLKKVGILGTAVTTRSKIYKLELDKYGISSCALPERELEPFNRMIFKEMLRGRSYEAMHHSLARHACALIDRGCEGIILGCTEFPLFIEQEDVPVPLYASTRLLAESVMERCLGPEEGVSGGIDPNVGAIFHPTRAGRE